VVQWLPLIASTRRHDTHPRQSMPTRRVFHALRRPQGVLLRADKVIE
jgi:hypothetical protein